MKNLTIVTILLSLTACSGSPEKRADSGRPKTVIAGKVLNQKVQQHRFTLIDEYGDRKDQHRVILDRTSSDRGKGGRLYDVDAKGNGRATSVRMDCARKIVLLGRTVEVSGWRSTITPAKGRRVEIRRADYAKTLCSKELEVVTTAAVMSQLPKIVINLQMPKQAQQ